MAASSPLQNTLTSKIRSSPSIQKRPRTDRNVMNVVLGDILFKTWYPSFYPEELVGHETERLCVCQWCFNYSKELVPYLAHVKMCPAKSSLPPGQMIYEKDEYSIWEVDGEEHKLFCQNLSLFAKLFLDNKSVFFDVTTFFYYLLVQTTYETSNSLPTRQVIGFFSKEKMSWDNNNLACILVFPPWQRKGLGKILMGVSYEITLSDLGRRGYLAYWSSAIAQSILAAPVRRTITIKDISNDTYIMYDDVMAALKEMDVFAPRKRADGVVVDKIKVRNWVSKSKMNLKSMVDPEAFVEGWVPQPSWEEAMDEDV
ncbi:MAG: hypothetical protein M1824_000212 [Vezdaea acicularis]|nr:MAG: hypothetical protein M1824_000212 [Vezdaea acicularis]